MARPHRFAARAALGLSALALALTPALGRLPTWTPGGALALAADAPTMTVHVLLGGHTRVGSWLAIAVDLANDGPALTGELRLDTTASGGSRYSVAVDLPTQSQKRYVLYAQPPNGFARSSKVALVDSNGMPVEERPVTFTVHDPSQLLVGVVAEKPGPIVNGLDLQAGPGGIAAAVVALGPADLPERAEVLAPLDRLVWQDADPATLRPEQLAALRTWIGAGGRLVIVSGTGGIGLLDGFPADLLPYRPAATVDVVPAALAGLLESIPAGAADVPAAAGALTAGHALATTGGQAVAADLDVGSGSVTLVGFDPTAGWLGSSTATQALWRRLLPPRSSGSVVAPADDSGLVQAVDNLPSLTLPPVTGLLALLAGYIVLIGPVNYLVLRRLDRREWAWITMPALIGLFAVGAYAYGSALRGSDVIVNQVAVVDGGQGSELGRARIYLGVFSPTRGTYQVSIPGGALLSGAISGDVFAGQPGPSAIDVVQGDPARVRDLAVGYGSVRTVRAETGTTAPAIHADLRVVDGRLVGSVRNDSQRSLEAAALVLGNSSQVLGDLAPGAARDVSLVLDADPLGLSLSHRIVGQVVGPTNAAEQRLAARHAIIDQLSFDPSTGMQLALGGDGPVLLGWGSTPPLDVRVEGAQARAMATVLYRIALPLTLTGHVALGPDLVRGSVVASDANTFNKDPSMIGLASGSLTMAYRPIGLHGGIDATGLTLSLGQPGDVVAPGGATGPIAPQPLLCKGASCVVPVPAPRCLKDPCPSSAPSAGDSTGNPGLPSVSLFDLRVGAWRTLPDLVSGRSYAVDEPARYVDPDTGTVLVRFTTQDQNGIGFTFSVGIEGTVR